MGIKFNSFEDFKQMFAIRVEFVPKEMITYVLYIDYLFYGTKFKKFSPFVMNSVTNIMYSV